MSLFTKLSQHASDGKPIRVTPFRKAYLRSLIDVIEVDDTQIRIKGSKDALERAVLSSRPEAEPRLQMSTKWRTRHDSNM